MVWITSIVHEQAYLQLKASPADPERVPPTQRQKGGEYKWILCHIPVWSTLNRRIKSEIFNLHSRRNDNAAVKSRTIIQIRKWKIRWMGWRSMERMNPFLCKLNQNTLNAKRLCNTRSAHMHHNRQEQCQYKWQPYVRLSECYAHNPSAIFQLSLYMIQLRQ